MITKETLEKIESETKSPKTFYETSNLAGENIIEGKVESKDKSASFVTPFRMDEKKYSSLPSSASSNYSVAIKICSDS